MFGWRRFLPPYVYKGTFVPPPALPESTPDSQIKSWFAAGGSLKTPLRKRVDNPLFPFLDKKRVPPRDAYAIFYVLGVIALFLFLISYANGGFRFRGSGSVVDSVSATSTEYRVPLGAAAAFPIPTLSGNEPPPVVLPTMTPLATIAPQIVEFTLPTPEGLLPPDAVLTPQASVPISPAPLSTSLPVECFQCDVVSVSLRLGYFFPPLGGSHCEGGFTYCEEYPLSDGKAWFIRLGKVAACPEQFPLGSFLYIGSLALTLECVHRLPLASCDWSSGVCDVLVLSPAAIVEDWHTIYAGDLYARQ